MADEGPELTMRQLAALQTAVRHISRAQASLFRAQVPGIGGFSPGPEWLHALNQAGQALAVASNRLIDGLEGLSNG